MKKSELKKIKMPKEKFDGIVKQILKAPPMTNKDLKIGKKKKAGEVDASP